MFTQRLKQFGLDKHLGLQGQDFQRAMGADLRRLVFQYVKGELPVEDGPAVKRFRKHADVIGGMDAFIQEQSRNGAWFTDLELSLLAELFDVNFIVQFDDGRTTTLRASDQDDQPIIVLRNTDNGSWDAILLDSQKDKETIHDGNCGPHAFARAIEPYAREVVTPRLQHSPELKHQLEQQEVHYRRSIEQYRLDEAIFTGVHDRLKEENPKEYERRMAQIDSDYQVALKIFLNDLPGVAGRPSKGMNSKTDYDVPIDSAAAESSSIRMGHH